jgi:hypothetical protein
LRGQVKAGVVVFENDSAPPDGTLVEVTPVMNVASTSGTPSASPPPYAVSEEQRKALLELIAMWKVQNPPSDEQVEQIIDEYRMKKYG